MDSLFYTGVAAATVAAVAAASIFEAAGDNPICIKNDCVAERIPALPRSDHTHNSNEDVPTRGSGQFPLIAAGGNNNTTTLFPFGSTTIILQRTGAQIFLPAKDKR